MIGAIAGDIIGSVYEANPIKTKDFPLFSPNSRITDDSVLTIAIAEVISSKQNYADVLREYYRRYPDQGYGYGFIQWAANDSAKPYNSYGNGSAMRVSPVSWAYHSLDDVLEAAKKSAEVSHNHEEGIKGAQAVAAAIFLARTGQTKDDIRGYIQREFTYDLERTIDDIRPGYNFDVSCQGSVPEAIIAFLDSRDYEDSVRNAVSLGGDADTMACIAGSIAEAYYRNIKQEIREEALARLPERLRAFTLRFTTEYCNY
jgi:ADP-ribosylglycohydrolase